tara:strand:- start:767 stop:1000 length:234 start_codon:yes stop_codon:yes gene_type:complete
MYKSILKNYSKKELMFILSSVKGARDKHQQIIDRLIRYQPTKKLKDFNRKSGILDCKKAVQHLDRQIIKLNELIASK